MVSGPYIEGVRGMRSHPLFGHIICKIMQFLAYIPNSDPKMVIFLKIRTPLFKRLCVNLGIMTEYLFHPVTGGCR